jgi:hypothetical protein
VSSAYRATEPLAGRGQEGGNRSRSPMRPRPRVCPDTIFCGPHHAGRLRTNKGVRLRLHSRAPHDTRSNASSASDVSDRRCVNEPGLEEELARARRWDLFEVALLDDVSRSSGSTGC